MIEIIPSILVQTKEELEAKLKKVESLVDRVHLDIADGVLVPNTTIQGYEEIKTLTSSIKWSVHLMVVQPEEQLAQWYNTPVDRIFIHKESRGDTASILQQIKLNGKGVGLVLNPETPVHEIIELVDLFEYIQFMTIHPGFSGREFLPEVVDKISRFHSDYPSIPIYVDGGINPDTAPKVVAAGATGLIVGSYIWEHADPARAIENLKKSVQ